MFLTLGERWFYDITFFNHRSKNDNIVKNGFLPSFDIKCFIELKEYFLHVLCLIVKGSFCAHLSSLNKFSSSFNAFRFSFIVYPIRVPNKDVCKSSGALSFIFTAPWQKQTCIAFDASTGIQILSRIFNDNFVNLWSPIIFEKWPINPIVWV